jgi:hypothetical protein
MRFLLTHVEITMYTRVTVRLQERNAKTTAGICSHALANFCRSSKIPNLLRCVAGRRLCCGISPGCLREKREL